MRTTTVAIASYQRRAALARLLHGIGDELVRSPCDAPGLDVLVVLDGSTDGSLEMVRRTELPVPLRVHVKANGGLSSARNAGLERAEGELVWFLDDDLAPSHGVIGRHRRAHDDGDHVVMGPCVIPDTAATTSMTKAFWEGRYGELAAAGAVVQFQHFSAANTSGPAAVFRALGGFDERFVGYGMEDYELGYRLLAAGVDVRFDAGAVMVHHQARGLAELVRHSRSEGRNAVRLATTHPGAADDIFPPGGASHISRRLWRLHLRTSRRLAVAARLLLLPASIEERRTPGRARFLEVARVAAFGAGVAEEDRRGSMVERVFGVDEPGRR